MNNRFNRRTAAPLAVAISFGLFACTPTITPTLNTQHAMHSNQPMQQKFVSDKVVTSDCGPIFIAPDVPGFAIPNGAEARDMPPPIAEMQAVGAGRELLPTDYDRVSSGYMLIEPVATKQSFLINNEKEVVATFEGDYYRGYTQILPNGNQLATNYVRAELFVRGGGANGCVEEISVEGDLLWRLNLNTDEYVSHHDVIKLENGNILALIWEMTTAEEAISLGRNPENVAEDGTFWWDSIIEVNPYTFEVVWEWSSKHHLIQDFDATKPNYGVVADHPGRMDINKFYQFISPDIPAEWAHTNAMDYHPELDQIVISSNYLGEIWVIDHSTTPRESITSSGGRYGKGGEFLYRWGNPVNYDRGTDEDRIIFYQHDVQWIQPGLPGAGNILIFNNGHPVLRPYSTVVEFTPDMNADGTYNLTENESYGPEELVWEYNPDPSEQFYSWFISGAQRQPNGNTLINHGANSNVREVTSDGEIVWDYSFRNGADGPHMLFRVYRFAPDHPGIVSLLENN